MDPNIGISDANRASVVKILQGLLADTVLLETKTRNAHWNITGPHFRHLHAMFGEQYEALAEGTDAIAERIRSLGGRPAATLGEFLRATRLKEFPGDFPDSTGWLTTLLTNYEILIRQLRTDADTVNDKYLDSGTNDFLIGLMEAHEKTAWMLRASLSA